MYVAISIAYVRTNTRSQHVYTRQITTMKTENRDWQITVQADYIVVDVAD